MKHLYPLLFFTCLFPFSLLGQVDSNAVQKDTLLQDSAKAKPRLVINKDTASRNDSSNISVLQNDSLALKDSLRLSDSLAGIKAAADSLQKKPGETRSTQTLKEGEKKVFTGKELLFYYLVFLLIIFGLLRQAFAKYFYDLFRVFFKTTLKQRQTQEQLLQSPLPSVFMNGFFILSTGLYVNFLLQHFQLSIVDNFWLQYLYCAGGLAAIYIVKFMGLKITGWLFNVSNATDAYTFIVFIINKMLGIFLLPFLLLLAFSSGPLYTAAMIISWFGIGLLLIYRFILSYGAVRKEVNLNSFHFILYILGFEVVPLLLIYKLLLVIF
jgi:hypothetical protein